MIVKPPFCSMFKNPRWEWHPKFLILKGRFSRSGELKLHLYCELITKHVSDGMRTRIAKPGRDRLLPERLLCFFCVRFDEDGYQLAGPEANSFKPKFFEFDLRER